jgi:hypothetical protein
MKIRTRQLVLVIAFIICQFRQGFSQANEANNWHNGFQKMYQGVSIYGSLLDLGRLNKSLLPVAILSVGPDFRKGKIWFSGRIQAGISGTSDTVFSPADHSSMYNWKSPLLYSGFEGEAAFLLLNRPRTRMFVENTLSAGVYSNSILPIDAFGYHSLSFRTLFDELGFIFDYRFKPLPVEELKKPQPKHHQINFRLRAFAVQSIFIWPRIQQSGIHLIPGFSLGIWTFI